MLKYQFMLANSLGGRGVVGGGRGAGADGAVNAQRMRALEGQVLQAKMESNESKEDAAKVRGNLIRDWLIFSVGFDTPVVLEPMVCCTKAKYQGFTSATGAVGRRTWRVRTRR